MISVCLDEKKKVNKSLTGDTRNKPDTPKQTAMTKAKNNN